MTDPTPLIDQDERAQETEKVLAVLDEIVPPADLVGGVELRPETWAALWWRDFVLTKALPEREFGIVHEEAKALAAVPRLLSAALHASQEAEAQLAAGRKHPHHALDCHLVTYDVGIALGHTMVMGWPTCSCGQEEAAQRATAAEDFIAEQKRRAERAEARAESSRALCQAAQRNFGASEEGYHQQIATLEAQLTEAHGAIRAQDEREAQAGEVCGVSRAVAGCDWPDVMAERVIDLARQLTEAQQQRTRLTTLVDALVNRQRCDCGDMGRRDCPRCGWLWEDQIGPVKPLPASPVSSSGET